MTDARDALRPVPERLSLREALGAAPDPDFELMLPVGWVRRGVTAEENARLHADVRERLQQAHRPDLYARVKPLLEDAFAKMADARVLATFAPGAQEEGEAVLPASVVASVRSAPTPGEPLDDLVRALVREGATPLLGDDRFLRFERERTQRVDDGEIRVTDIVYLTPIPGTRRTRALQLTATILRPEDAPADDRVLVLTKAVLDLSVSSLVWRAPA